MIILNVLLHAILQLLHCLSIDAELMEDNAQDTLAATDRTANLYTKSSIMSRFKGIRLGSFGRGALSKRRPAVLQEVSIAA